MTTASDVVKKQIVEFSSNTRLTHSGLDKYFVSFDFHCMMNITQKVLHQIRDNYFEGDGRFSTSMPKIPHIQLIRGAFYRP